MAAIRIKSLSKSYAETPVLRSIDLAVNDGEFLVLVGPSGCGKSTLLRLIAGLEEPSSGDIFIGERRVNELEPKDRDVAMVFQSYALYPHMTVRENMSFSLKLRGLGAERIAGIVQSASQKLGIEALLDRKPRALSGGQRQRVAMGRAMVREPAVFLFDEPLSNLDARLREQMRYEIRKLQRELGTTSIYVTHDQIEAMTMADRIVAMHEGVAQQIGTPTELYENPSNLFVAGFIGSPAMNFVEVTLQEAGSGVAAMLGDHCLCRLPHSYLLRSDRRAIVGIRPERITLASQAPLSARIELIEPTGLGSVIHLAVGAQRLKVFSAERSSAGLNAQVGLIIDHTDALLFDPDSGERMRSSSP
jgi:multiple sugar transport system ATP-binding protein